MTLFSVFFAAGILELWLLLFFWGFSAGAVNAVPFITLVGCFTLLFAAAPLALFLGRISGVFALVGATLALAWPVAAAFDSSLIDVLAVGLLPVTAFSVAAVSLWRTRNVRWLATVSTPSLRVRVLLSVLPFALFAVLFNERLVLALLFTGPPR